DDLEEWDCLIGCLADRILWDADFEMGEHFLDADPNQSRTLLEHCRIPEAYFLEIAPDPTAEQLEQIRSTLRGITGRPEPEGPELVLGLEDTYHDLFVGPCDPEVLDKESACRLVTAIEVLGPDNFDCSYAEWARLLRQQMWQAAAEEPVALPDPATILSPEQLDEAERAKRTGRVLLVSDGHQIESRDGGWVVVDDTGDVLIEVGTCAWAADGGDPDL